MVLRCFPWDQERHHGAEEKHHAVVDVADNGQGRDLEDGGHQEDLGAPGDETLADAGEDVQGAGSSLGFHPVGLGDVFGHAAGDEDGDGVVGGAEVGEKDEDPDARLGDGGAPFAGCHTADAVGDQPLQGQEAPLGFHELAQATDEDGEDEDLLHACEAVVGLFGQGQDREVRGDDEPCDTGQNDPRQKHGEHVEPGDGHHKNGRVGQGEEHGGILGFRHAGAFGLEEKHQDGQDGGRQRHRHVDAELVLHLTPLGAGGGDGGVRDDGEVVSEHRATGDGSGGQGHGKPRFTGDACGDGGQGCNGSHGGAHGCGDESAHDKEAGQEERGRYCRDGYGHHRIHTAGGLGHGAEATGQKVDHAHGHDVAVSGPAQESLHGVCEALSGEQNRQDDGGQGCHRGRYLVEGKAGAQALEIETASHKDGKEEAQGEEGRQMGLGGNVPVHGWLPL